MRTLFAALVIGLFTGSASAADWPQWRGPKGDGIVTDPAVPTIWGASKNVVWKVPVPGVGLSSPIVSNGKVFLTSFDATSNTRNLLCFDRKSGVQLWLKTILIAPPEKMHKNNTPASATVTADNERVWVVFLDVDHLAVACYDMAGQQLWLKKIGGFISQHGFCGSPVLYQNLLIVNGDSDGDAFLAALDKRTGETKWKIDRPNRVRSFSVPRLIEVNGQTQMVLAGSKSIAGFDPATGRQIWIVDSATMKFVATVSNTEGLIFATGTSPVNSLAAIDPTGTGNVTKSHVKWLDTKTAAYVPSPLAFRDRLFVLNDSGIGTMMEAKTGRKIWSERLAGQQYHSSPLLINDLIYCFAEDGTAVVLKASDELEILAKNKLPDSCQTTPQSRTANYSFAPPANSGAWEAKRSKLRPHDFSLSTRRCI